MAKRRIGKNKGEDGDEISKEVKQKYKQRLIFLKQAREFFRQEDFINASRNYLSYLQILAEYKQIPEPKLSPAHFDPEKDMSELLLISHCYWDLAKIFDRSGKTQKLELYLMKFVEFSIGFKYQTPNSGMLRRFIKKKKLIHKKYFDSAYKQMRVNKKKCYVATHLYGETHPMTRDLRLFRSQIVRFKLGEYFSDFYHAISPHLVKVASSSPFLSFSMKIFFVPIIRTLHLGLKAHAYFKKTYNN